VFQLQVKRVFVFASVVNLSGAEMCVAEMPQASKIKIEFDENVINFLFY
jgi:hypothetical protein